MPVTYEILREGRVVQFTYSAAFTMAEVAETFETFQKEVLANATEKVHTINDLSAVKQIPPNVLSSSMSMIKSNDPRVGTMFVVTHYSIIKKLADILRKLFPMGGIIICGTVAEAQEAADHLLGIGVSKDTEEERITPPIDI